MLNRLTVMAFALITICSCSEKPDNATPMGIGDPEDPNARIAWDIERMRDPATGEIPENIRRLELEYAKKLPVRTGPKAINWNWRGPRNRGGRTRALAIDVLDPDVILAGGVTGGMWRSADAGNSWVKTSIADNIQSVSCVVQDTRPGHENTWYYGTGENYGIVSGTSFTALVSGDGIFKSTDGGQSWTHLPSTIWNLPQNFNINGSFKKVNRMVIDPTDTINDVVLAAVFNGIMRSTDGGTSWTAVLGADSGATQLSEHSELVVSPTGVFYASVGDGSAWEGLYRSTDGINWVNISGGSGYASSVERTVIAIDPQDENKVLFFGQSAQASVGTNGHVLFAYRYLSGDGSGSGGSWENRSANLPADNCTGYFTFDFAEINTQGGYDMAIAVHPADTNVIYLGGTNVYRSTDAFRTADSTKWIGGYKCTPSDPKDYVWDNHHPDIHYLLFTRTFPTELWTASDGGVHRCLDALADSVFWQDRNAGYATSQFYTIHIDENTPNDERLIGGTQDNGTFYTTSDDPNDDWFWVHRDDGAYGALPTGANFILASSQRGRLYKKELDANSQVIGFERIDPLFGTTGYNFINQFVLDPRDNNQLYWVSASRIWKNTDLAGIPIANNWYDKIDSNWQLLSTANLPASQRISALDISYWQRSLMYGTVNAHIHRLDSLDGVMTRTEVTGANMPFNGYVSCIAPNDHNPEEWMMTFSNYRLESVWHTLDNGDSWVHVSGNLEENPDGSGNGPACFWTSIYPGPIGGSNTYFVGTSTGLYSTDFLDGGNTVWVQEGPNSIGNVPINMIATRLSDGVIAVATHGNGIYGSTLTPAPLSVDNVQIRTEHRPAYPNPTSSQVVVPYTLILSGTVAIQVFDLSGKLVLSEALGLRKSGSHAYVWNIRNSHGSRVNAGEFLVNIIRDGNPIGTQRIIVQ